MATMQSKGDLEITILEARNLGVKHPSNLYCTLAMPHHKPLQTSTSKGSQWNQTFNLDLWSLDNDELSIELFKQRRIKKDKFLGQIQIPIRALKLPKEATWYFLCDRPEVGSDETPSWILLINPEHQNMRKSVAITNTPVPPPTLKRDKRSYIISGEILIKLRFVHRLLRARTEHELRNPKLYSTIGPSTEIPGNSFLQIATNKKLSRAITGPYPMNEDMSLPPAPLPPTNEKEANIIDEALKEKQKIAREKLNYQKKALKDMTIRITNKERSEGETAVRDDKMKLEELQKNMMEVEAALESGATVTKTPVEKEESPQQIREHDSLSRSAHLRMGVSKRHSPHHTVSKSPKHLELPRLNIADADYLANNLANLSSSSGDDLAGRVRVLEIELAQERRVSEALRTSNTLLEKEVKRLEAEIDREKWEKERLAREEQWKERMLEIEKMFLRQQIVVSNKEEKEEKEHIESLGVEDKETDEQVRHFTDRGQLAESMLKEVEMGIKNTNLHRQRLHTEMMENKLKKRQQVLKKVQEQQKMMESKMTTQEEEEAESSGNESDDEEDEADHDGHTRIPSPRKHRSSTQLDMLVMKLEKLDKLDELLRKLDTMKVAPSGTAEPGAGTNKKFAELKSELEKLQTIIIDENGKFSEKEKADANIRYEKVFQIYQNTDEFKRELANMMEERRKKNEPLNKAALVRVLERYSPENLKSNASLKERLQKSPELNLIFMDPKAILAKHQNDFQQYLLNKLDVDELRAIRACLPKFRTDQTRQLDWVEFLEQKIEQVANAPPVKHESLRKKEPIKFKKPKNAAPPGDLFSELMQKSKTREEGKRTKKNTVSLRTLRLRGSKGDA